MDLHCDTSILTMLEYIVHVLRLYKACDAPKIVATKLCGSPFLLGCEYELLIVFVLFVQRACRYGTVGSFMIFCVFLGMDWCVCSFICLSVCGYGTTDIKLLSFVVQVIV